MPRRWCPQRRALPTAALPAPAGREQFAVPQLTAVDTHLMRLQPPPFRDAVSQRSPDPVANRALLAMGGRVMKCRRRTLLKA